MYSGGWCGYCARARALFESKDLAYTDINVETTPGMREEMMQRSGRRTVPQIFIGEVHVGGSDELFALEHCGKLDELLGKQPAGD